MAHLITLDKRLDGVGNTDSSIFARWGIFHNKFRVLQKDGGVLPEVNIARLHNLKLAVRQQIRSITAVFAWVKVAPCETPDNHYDEDGTKEALQKFRQIIHGASPLRSQNLRHTRSAHRSHPDLARRQ